MNLPFFAFYPGSWISDPKILSLSFEEKGILIDLFCHMWNYKSGECRLPDKDNFISRLLGISHHKWKKIKAIYVEELGILNIKDEYIYSTKLMFEFEKSCLKSRLQRKKAESRWCLNVDKPLINKDHVDAAALPWECHKDLDKERTNKHSRKKNISDEVYEKYFVEFWNLYPADRRDQKSKCKVKLKKYNQEAREAILVGLKKQLAEHQLRKELNAWCKTWKLSSTWINNLCWEDEVCLEKEKLIEQNNSSTKKPGTNVWDHNIGD